MWPAALRVAIALAALYVVVVAFAYVFQHRLALPGRRRPAIDPAQAGLGAAERVAVPTSDGLTLFGWLLHADPPPAGPAPALIWFYGNFETIYDLAPVLQWLRPPGVAVLIADYRGYGGSPGRPSERGLYLDAEAAWDFLRSRPEIDARRIAVYGRSIGSAAALYLATERPVCAVVLDSPFTSARAMARRHYPFIPTAIVRLGLNNLDRARRLTAPLLVFHGSRDRVAPAPMGAEVAQAGRAESFIVIEGADHNDLYGQAGETYRMALHAFLARHLAKPCRSGDDHTMERSAE